MLSDLENQLCLSLLEWSLTLVKFMRVVRIVYMRCSYTYGLSAEFWILVFSLSGSKIRF